MPCGDAKSALGGPIHAEEPWPQVFAKRRKLGRRRAHEQVSANFALQPLDGGCQGGLTDSATFGGTGKIPFAADRKKITDLLQIHVHLNRRETTALSLSPLK
jgi:hypothetical protein